MKRIRVFQWISVLTVLALLMVSCAQATTAPGVGEEPAEEEPVEEEVAPEIEVVTVTVWDFGGAEFQWMDTSISAFQEAFPNIEIDHVGVPEGEIGLKLETAIAAGKVPDLVVFVGSRVVKAGHVLFLDDYMARDGISRDDYCPLFESWSVMEDKVYSLPVDTNVWAMIYNKDLFAEAGLPELGTDDVITYDDWLAYARAINKPAESLEDRVWGSAFFWPTWNPMNNYMSDPFVLGDDGRTCVGNTDTDDWMHYYELMLATYDEDLTPLTAGALLADVMEEDMMNQGKIGMRHATFGDALFARDNGVNVGLTGQPVVSPGWDGNVGGWNTSYAIMAGSEHPDEAWEFLKWLSLEAPKVVPIAADMDAQDGGGLAGLPCYLPLFEHEKIATMIEGDPLIADGVALMQRIKAPPFSVRLGASTDPFEEALRRIWEDREDIAVAVGDATQECQEITDELWEEFDALGE